MTGRIVFTVPGKPIAKGRPRASARIVPVNGKPTAIVSIHTPKETVAAEKAVRLAYLNAARGAKPLTCPVKVTVEAIFAVPPSWPKAIREAAATGKLWHVGRPDGDNLEKLILDSLNEIAWVDDGQIAVMIAAKRYGHPERTVITIEPLNQADLPSTPGQKRTEARAASDAAGIPRNARVKPAKGASRKRLDKLQAAIDAAIARDAAS